ncbi:MAG: glycosyl hydrolase family 28-related protein, partial [Acidobacteriota bacterium]
MPGGKICTYLSGGFSPAPTYTSNSGAVQNSNPVVLDSGGNANIWFGASTYRVVFQEPGDSNCPGTGSTIWTQDGIADFGQLLKNGLAASTGSTLVGFEQLGSSTLRTVQAKLEETISVKDFGATGNGTTDDTAAIQAALNAATAGQRIYCPQGVYKISAEIVLPSYVNFFGVRTDLQSGQAADGGCTLKWAGSAPATAYAHGSAMVEAYGVYGTRLSGINLDGNSTTNLTGYMVDADPGLTNASQRNSFRDALVQNFGTPASNLAGAGVVCGSGTGSDQADGNEFVGIYMYEVYEGFRIQSRNCDYSRYTSFAIAAVNSAMHITAGGYAEWTNWSAGTMLGANPHVIWIDGQY